MLQVQIQYTHRTTCTIDGILYGTYALIFLVTAVLLLLNCWLVHDFRTRFKYSWAILCLWYGMCTVQNLGAEFHYAIGKLCTIIVPSLCHHCTIPV